MELYLDPKYEARLYQLAEAAGMTVAEYLRHIIDAQVNGPAVRDTPAIAAQQRATLAALMAELDQMPLGNPTDGWSGAEHDEVLYGRNA